MDNYRYEIFSFLSTHCIRWLLIFVFSFENVLKVRRFMRVFGVFEMECNHSSFVELTCGARFKVSTWGFWCILWNVDASKLKLAIALSELFVTFWFWFFDLFALGIFYLMWMGLGCVVNASMVLLHLSFALLHTTNDSRLFYFTFSYFLSMSNLI